VSGRSRALGNVLLASVLVGSALAAGCSSPDGADTSAPPIETSPESLPDTVARVRSGVVRIETTGCSESGIGSGFIVDPRHVVTVEHVVVDAARIEIKRDGKVVARGTVIGADPVRDLALVQLDKSVTGFRFRFARKTPRIGDEVAALGFPLGLPLTLTRGTVSGLNRTVLIVGVNRRRMIQTDAALKPGNSGGPLLAVTTGDVIGLVDAGNHDAEGISFAVSGAVAEPLVRAWRAAPQPQPLADCGTVSDAGGATEQPPVRSDNQRFTSVDRLQRCVLTNTTATCGSGPSGRHVRLVVGGGARETGRGPAPDRGGPALPMGRSLTNAASTIQCDSSSRGVTCTDLTTGDAFTIGDYKIVFASGSPTGRGQPGGGVGLPATYQGFFTSVDRLQRCLAESDSVVCTSGPSGQGVGLTAGAGAAYGGVVGSSDTGGPSMPMGTGFTTPSNAISCSSSSRGITCVDRNTQSSFVIGDHYVIVRNSDRERRYTG
jgi:Trypsin-like peptidase domain